MRRVANVVCEVGRARGGAVGGERDQRVGPEARLAELAGEEQSGEEEEVLRPLARAERDPGRARDRPRLGGGGDGHTGRMLTGWAGRQLEVEPAAGADLALELDPATERQRELARDRQAQPRPAAVP